MAVMGMFFNIFGKGKTTRKSPSTVETLDSMTKRIVALTKELSNNTGNEFGARIELQKLYARLSTKLFDAVDVGDFDTVAKIAANRMLSKKYLVDKRGCNVIEHSLFNNNNRLFRYLFENHHEMMVSYFDNIPELFTIVVNSKNLELVKYFLTNDFLSRSLDRNNVTTCLFLVLQSGRKDLVGIIAKDFADALDARNIEASMIYAISHNQDYELKLLFSYPTLIAKFSNGNIEKMVAYSIMNRNVAALEVMMRNEYFIGAIELMDKNVSKNILKIAYGMKNNSIVDIIMKNKCLKGNVGELLRIEAGD